MEMPHLLYYVKKGTFIVLKPKPEEKTIFRAEWRKIGPMERASLRHEILKVIENNSRLTTEDLAAMLGVEADLIEKEIRAMEEERVICGYPSLIDWDKVNDTDKVTALIEVKITPKRGEGFDYMANRIYKFEEVSYVYLMSADYDLMVIVEGKTMREVANFVSGKLAPMDSVISTATHFVLKKYKEHGISYVNTEIDERELIIP